MPQAFIFYKIKDAKGNEVRGKMVKE